MFAGFNVTIENKERFLQYFQTGLSLFENHKGIINESLKEYINPDYSLSAEKMEEDWFPKVAAHVFLSHSHNDLDFVIAFAGWLYEKFKIIAFIDSNVWNNSDDLLKLIDNKYCVSSLYSDNAINTYNYKLRNISTSNVHMILYTALVKMIDNTECLMFLNTPSSLKWSDMISGRSTALSPWIYGELLASKLLRNRSRMSHRTELPWSILEHTFENAKKLSIEYTLNIKHLTNISDSELIQFEKEAQLYTDAYNALDLFYTQNKIILNEEIINE